MFKLFWVTDRTLCPGDFLSRLEAIAKARPDGIILREKDLAPEDYRALAEEAMAISARYDVPCILHTFAGAARDLGASTVQVFRRVILPLSLPGVLSGITMVFVPSVSTFAISKMLGGGTEMLLGDLIEQQFLGGAYNPQLGAAISLVMMVIVVVCMVVMNRFGEGEEQAVML